MNYSDKLDETEKLLFEHHAAQALNSAAGILENYLRELYGDAQPRLNANEQKEIAAKLAAMGENKTIAQLTLGQVIGLYRDTKFLDKLERATNKKYPRLRAADLNGLLQIRNEATHQGAVVHADDAQLFVSQVRVLLREGGKLPEPKTSDKKASSDSLRAWTKCVRLNSDVEAGNTALATYAIDLGAVIAGDKNVPHFYRDAEAFFRVTYPTASMQRLMREVLARLAGEAGDRVLQLRSPFGGGKSHLLLALYHAVQNRAALLKHWSDTDNLPDPRNVRVAWFDGEKFDVTGKIVGADLVSALPIRPQTMWGWLAWQLGGADLYREVAYQDERKVALAGDGIAKLLDAEQPTLILLDEVLKYFERADADNLAVGNSTLGRQTLDFIQSLSTEVAHRPNTVMIYSLQASTREAFGNARLLDMLDHLTARVDAKREPIQGDEILPVLQRRLLADLTDADAHSQTAHAYSETLTQMRKALATDAATRRAAEDEGAVLRKRFYAAYPFHPTLVDIMSQRWASIPDFQRTRGALRFLATCLHTLKRDDKASALLGASNIPLYDADVVNAFFTEVGQGEAFKAVLLHDFNGPNARAKRIDERLAREYPHLSGVRPATQIATAILMYSFGGVTRAGESDGDPLGAGVSESELLASVVSPDLDRLTAEATLKQLRDECLYLHYDGARYVFKTTPNVTQLLEEEAESRVRAEDARAMLKEQLLSRLGGRPALVWTEKSADIPDGEPRFTLAYLPLDFASLSDGEQEKRALEYLTKYGDTPRKYRNALGLALPDARQIEALRRAAKYVQAIQALQSKRAALNLTREQLAQLKERESTEKSALEAGLRNLYPSVWLPKLVDAKIEIEKLDIGSRALGATGIHERLMELVMTNERRVFATITPSKLIELMRLGENADSPLGATTAELLDAFFGILGFPRLENESVLRRAIAKGVSEGVFGYVSRASSVERDRLRQGSGYYVGNKQATIAKSLSDDEIDLSGGFIVLPNGIEPEATVAPPTTDSAAATSPLPSTDAGGITYQPTASQSGYSAAPTRVRLRATMNRQQIFASFNALANLADKAGVVELIIQAQTLDGFDNVWLRNAVIEPLDEAGVEIKREV